MVADSENKQKPKLLISKLIVGYESTIIKRPRITLFFSLFIIFAFALFIPRIQLDVSADSLILENDKDLNYYREIRSTYGSDDFLIITLTPKQDLFSDPSIQQLTLLKSKLHALPHVDSVISILDVPLIESPPQTLEQVSESTLSLLSPQTDFEKAKQELTESPLYRNRLTSTDGRTTAIQLNFKKNPQQQQLKIQKETLLAMSAYNKS